MRTSGSARRRARDSSTRNPSTRTASTPPSSAGATAKGTRFSQRIEKQGTRDLAAWLTVPDAIRFQAERDWDAVRGRSRWLARKARRDLCDLLRTEPLAPDSMVAQMATVQLPRPSPELSQRLFARHRVEIPVGGPQKDLLRLSIAGYTTCDEIDRLLAALVRELDAEHRQRDE
jgi:isopenicillin-N epimerase